MKPKNAQTVVATEKKSLQTKEFIMNVYYVLYSLMTYGQGNAPHSGESDICS